MCSWLSVAIATVTCLSISPIACLPLHDVADGGGERRELLDTWLEPSDVMTNPSGPEEFAQSAKSLLLDKPRDSGSDVLDLLLAMRDPSNDPAQLGRLGGADAVVRKRGQSKVDDYGHGMFWGKRGAWLQRDEVQTGRADQQTKRAHDEYGFGLLFGKREGADYEDFAL